MNDASPEVAARLDALFAARSGSDRVLMTCEMFTLARALMVANIHAEAPNITASELRVRIFERTYSQDLSADDCRRVIAHLRK